jgi:hypothetical protein
LMAGDKRRKPAFEVHAKVRVRPGDKVGREQLVHYVTRPPFAEDQRQLLDEERVRLELRRPLRSGQTEIILHPLALLRRLVWLVPPPRHCPRGGSKEPHRRAYSGADARGGGSVIVPPDPIRPSPRPQRKFRPAVVLAGRISVQRMLLSTDRLFEPLTPEPFRVAWAQLLARVYDDHACACPACPGKHRPAGAVLSPHAATWLRTNRIYPVGALAPPTDQRSLALPEVN